VQKLPSYGPEFLLSGPSWLGYRHGLGSCAALAPLLLSLVMVSADVCVRTGRGSTFLVLLVLEVSDDLTEEATVLVTELLVLSHVGRPEPRTEMCRRSGKRKCVP
jgi:hypothetical protein